LNAATFGTGADSKESRIQAAILAAPTSGASRVYVPANMYPYSASSVSFIYTVQMVREGGDWSTYDVWAYGAAGNNSTDDTAALQGAISGAGRGASVTFPKGVYRFTSTLSAMVFQRWVGDAHPPGSGTEDGSVLKFMNSSGTAISSSEAMGFNNLTVVNDALTYTDASFSVAGSTAIGVAANGDIVAQNCHFRNWHTIFSFLGGSYTKFIGCDLSRSAIGFKAGSQMFNLECDGTTFRFVNNVALGVSGFQFENFKMMGGSVELYTAAFNNIVDASLFGTYFESTYTGAFGFYSDTPDSTVALHLYGCKIFLNWHNRFINFSGVSEGTLVSIGNQLEVGTTTAATGQTQTYLVAGTAYGGRYVMAGDTMHGRSGVSTSQMVYIDSMAGRSHDFIVMPYHASGMSLEGIWRVPSAGTSVLGSNGSVNVANTFVKTGDLILLTNVAPAGTAGILQMTGIRDSSGFTIASTNVADTSTVAWMITRAK